MGFSRFVEAGRVALINFGPDEGKLCTIVDFVDQNKCLVDGPFSVTGVSRKVVSFSRLALTDFVVKIERGARGKAVVDAWKEEDILAKWEATPWAKKLAKRKKRASLSDFDRFKVMVAKKQKTEIIAKKMAEMS